MKRILVFILFLQIGVFNGISQNDNDYVKVDQSKVDAVIKSIIKENAGASPENKAWAEQLLKNAFGSYFSNNMINVNIDNLNTEKTELESECKAKSDTIRKLRGSSEKLNRKINSLETAKTKLESECEAKSDTIRKLRGSSEKLNSKINLLETAKTELESECKAKSDTIKKLRGSILNYNKNLVNMRYNYNLRGDTINNLRDTVGGLRHMLEDYEKLGSKKDSLEQNIIDLCDEYNYIGGVGISDIEEKVKEYNSFIAFYSSESNKDYKKPEIKEKLEYLDALVKAEDFYQRATESMSEKYDEVINSKLIENYKASLSEFDKLNNNQKDKLKSVYDALCGLPEAMDHFRKRLFNYLNDLKVMPDRQVDYNKNLLKKRVVEYCGKEQYNEYYIYLNKVLNEKILGELRSMTKEDDYQNFLKDIEKSL